jgi:SAM-dependent methyltransferase
MIMEKESKESKVQWVYASRDNVELTERYDEWATDYDAELETDFGYLGPQETAKIVVKYVPREARILDAGAGTGLMGQVLADLGYEDMLAADMSPGMLEAARAKNVYRGFQQIVLGETLDFPTDAFDAVVSVGVFTVGHAPASGFDELVRVTKSSGHIVFTLRPDVHEESGFKEKQEELEAAGKWKLVEVSDSMQLLPTGEPNVFHQIWVYQVL